jgi:hypothetical protein
LPTIEAAVDAVYEVWSGEERYNKIRDDWNMVAATRAGAEHLYIKVVIMYYWTGTHVFRGLGMTLLSRDSTQNFTVRK